MLVILQPFSEGDAGGAHRYLSCFVRNLSSQRNQPRQFGDSDTDEETVIESQNVVLHVQKGNI